MHHRSTDCTCGGWHPMEAWQSGRMRAIANRVMVQIIRGFKSLRLPENVFAFLAFSDTERTPAGRSVMTGWECQAKGHTPIPRSTFRCSWEQ